MELKETKKLIAYAKKQGIKSLKYGDFEITFGDEAILPQKTRLPKQKTQAPEPPSFRTASPPEPTLEQINQYIYGNLEEAQSA